MQTICAECGGVFPAEETIRYGNVNVCAVCKPRFMQKLAEGAAVSTGDFHYAGFWIRFLALFIDGLVLNALTIAAQMAAGLTLSQAVGVSPKGSLTVILAALGFSVLVNVLYETIMIGKYGATLGKMACGLVVVTRDGGKVSYGLAVGRYFAKILSSLTIFIGYLMAAFDPQKRALHDRICGTLVIRK